jgi:hypothetical protein
MTDVAPKSGLSGLVWGWSIRNLTTLGLTKFIIDALTVVCSLMLISAYPGNDASYRQLFSWVGSVVVLGLIVRVFAPSFVRVMYGSFEHFIASVEGDDKE